MEYAYSILMFAFAVMILLYAALVAPGNFDMIPRNYAVKVSNKKEYARKFAKVLCVVAISPAISGLIALAGLTLLDLITVLLDERDVLYESNDQHYSERFLRYV